MYRWKRLHLLFLVTLLILTFLSISAASPRGMPGTAPESATLLMEDSGSEMLLTAADSGSAPMSATTDDNGEPLLSTWATIGLFLVLGSGAFLLGSRFVPRA